MHPGIRWSGIERRIGSNGLSGERKGYVDSQTTPGSGGLPKKKARKEERERKKKDCAAAKIFF